MDLGVRNYEFFEFCRHKRLNTLESSKKKKILRYQLTE